jgi:protein-tyrosine phosphatase
LRPRGDRPLIDLHSHILPGVDDGSPDIETSLAMARRAVADGIEVMACTPHIMPGVYANTATSVRADIERLDLALRSAGIPLRLVPGADIHMSPTLAGDIADGKLLALNESRYFLIEPPHHVLPPRFEEFAFGLLAAGHVPVLTHPERLSWIDGHFDVIERLGRAGVLMQVTAGSLTGRFGRRPRYWAERMLSEGRIHLLATDAHDNRRRPPLLAEGRAAAAARIGEAEAERLVATNPLNVLENMLPSEVMPASGEAGRERQSIRHWARRLFGLKTQERL